MMCVLYFKGNIPNERIMLLVFLKAICRSQFFCYIETRYNRQYIVGTDSVNDIFHSPLHRRYLGLASKHFIHFSNSAESRVELLIASIIVIYSSSPFSFYSYPKCFPRNYPFIVTYIMSKSDIPL